VRALAAAVRPALVFHLAGTTRPLGWEGLWAAHVRATMNLMEALAALPRPPRVVLSGSSGEYGAAGEGAISETAPLNPVTLYGSTKRCQSLAALSYRHAGLSVLIARIFNVLGPGVPAHLAPGAFARQVAEIEQGRAEPHLAVGNLSPRRDYLDVRDVARALADIASRGVPGEAYNVCSGSAHSMGELLDRMISLSERRISVVADPAKMRGVDVPVVFGSHRKLTRLSGWAPRVSLQQSVADTMAWHRAPPGARRRSAAAS
ncbi:MAG: GDPmannose 4,6-dehydratase, partial [Elusimicrobia bacterium]